MARKQNGGFNKFLNIIGLVDAPQRETYDDYSSDNYGRPSTYIPSRQRSTGDQNSSSQRRSLPAQGSRSSSAQRTYGGYEDDRASTRRRTSSYDDDYSTEYTAPAAPRSASRPRSRFEEPEEPVRESAPEQLPARSTRSSGTQRTVMFSLSNLRDANRVITALVKGNTIVMTIDTDDDHLRERIVDTLSGAVFALNADIRKATDQTYVLAPKTASVRSAYEVDDRF